MASKLFLSIKCRSFSNNCNFISTNRLWGSVLISKIHQNSTYTTVDPEEVVKHSKLMNEWWNPYGAMKALHSMNEVRIPFIRDGLVHEPFQNRTLTPLLNKKILDVGCGGGILSEPLARLGADVTGVDASEELIGLAQNHAKENQKLNNKIPQYLHTTIEDHVKSVENHYDGVVASEIIEHVADKELFVKSCLKALKPKGRIFFTSPNRTPLAKLTGIFFAENVLNIVPKGTHDYNKFIKPNELTFLLERNNCHVEIIYGAYYSVLRNRWYFIRQKTLMYALQAVKLQ